MPRTRFEDDPRDGDVPHRPERAGNGLLVGLLVAGGLLVVLVCGGGLAFLFVARTAVREEAVAVREREAAIRAENRAEAQMAEAKAAGGVAGMALRSRKDFEGAVRGKTRDEVTKALGRPAHTHEEIHELGPVGPEGRGAGVVAARFDWWVYRDRVTDDATGKPFAEVRVRFGPTGLADRFEYR
jgi:hypothetical protein